MPINLLPQLICRIFFFNLSVVWSQNCVSYQFRMLTLECNSKEAWVPEENYYYLGQDIWNPNQINFSLIFNSNGKLTLNQGTIYRVKRANKQLCVFVQLPYLFRVIHVEWGEGDRKLVFLIPCFGDRIPLRCSQKIW